MVPHMVLVTFFRYNNVSSAIVLLLKRPLSRSSEVIQESDEETKIRRRAD